VLGVRHVLTGTHGFLLRLWHDTPPECSRTSTRNDVHAMPEQDRKINSGSHVSDSCFSTSRTVRRCRSEPSAYEGAKPAASIRRCPHQGERLNDHCVQQGRQFVPATLGQASSRQCLRADRIPADASYAVAVIELRKPSISVCRLVVESDNFFADASNWLDAAPVWLAPWLTWAMVPATSEVPVAVR